MRLLFLSNFYPPNELGGYAQLCDEVAAGLRNRGHNVHVLTSRHGNPSGRTGTREVTRSLWLETGINHYRPVDFFAARRRRNRFNARELHRVIERFGPDLVVVWGMWNLSWELPFWAERWLSGRVMYYIASYWPIDVDPHRNYWNLPARRPITELIKRPLRTLAFAQLHREGYPPRLRFEHVRCCSRYVRDTLVNSGKLPHNSGVVYGGIDTQQMDSDPVANRDRQDGKLRLVCFGRLVPDKGVHTAIEALGQLKQRGLAAGVDLTIIGDGRPDYEALLRKMSTELNVDGQVDFVGRVARDRIPELLRKYDVHLFTSIWPEPMARSVMESMAAGLIVVGSEVGGQVEMLEDGENALTYPAGDAKSLAYRILRVLEDPESRIRWTRAGRHTVLKRFSLDRMVADIEVYLSDIIEQASWSQRHALVATGEKK